MVELNTSIARLTNETKLEPNQAFNEIMARIPQLIQDADKLIAMNIDDVTDEQIEDLQAKFKATQEFRKDVDSSLQQIKKMYNDERDTVIAQINQALSNNQYDKILSVDTKLKQLNKDKLARRKQLRWQEVNDIFDATLKAYPDVAAYAPQLCDFSAFHIANPKLVTGSKSGKIGDKHRQFVNNTIETYNEGIQQIKQNPLGLLESYQQQLLSAFIANPTIETISNTSIALKQRQDYELKMLEEQRKRQEQLKQQQLAQQANVVQPQPNPPVQPTNINPAASQEPLRPNQIKSTNEWEWLVNFAFSNPSYARNPHDERLKLNLIVALLNQCKDPNSIVAKNTKLQPKAVLDMLRYVITNM